MRSDTTLILSVSITELELRGCMNISSVVPIPRTEHAMVRNHSECRVEYLIILYNGDNVMRVKLKIVV